jgi:hypothetical protein
MDGNWSVSGTHVGGLSAALLVRHAPPPAATIAARYGSIQLVAERSSRTSAATMCVAYERNERSMDIGLTLPNRGVLLGATTPDQMLDLAEAADRSGLFRSVWVGDSLLGKPRMESVALLAGIAARTRRVRL